MYTVARFRGDASAVDRLLEIGEAMNSLRPAIFTGLHRGGSGFVCDVYKDGSWLDHERAIGGFLAEFAGPIQQARDAGITVTIDVALDVEDRERATAYVCIRFEVSLLLALGSAGVRLEITSY
jgi:hypothetical protein